MSDGNWMQLAVRRFHREMDPPHPAPEQFDPDGFRFELRAKLILEEAAETAQALGYSLRVEAEHGEEPSIYLVKIAEPDWPLFVDGLCGTLFVTFGAAVEAGVNLSPFFWEVCRSNMTKLGGGQRADGKGLKPAHYEPPRFGEMWQRVLERAGRA